jgi:hypothetical protein
MLKPVPNRNAGVLALRIVLRTITRARAQFLYETLAKMVPKTLREKIRG